MHAHNTAINAPSAVETGVDHGHDGGCSFCSVVKERTAVVDDFQEYVPLRNVACHKTLVAQLIHDRRPLQTAGRAPPVVA